MLNENRFLGTFRGHNTRTNIVYQLYGSIPVAYFSTYTIQ